MVLLLNRQVLKTNKVKRPLQAGLRAEAVAVLLLAELLQAELQEELQVLERELGSKIKLRLLLPTGILLHKSFN